MDSAFNPDTFLDQSTDQAGSRRPPIASGVEFLGEITSVSARNVEGKKNPGEVYTFCDIQIRLDLTTVPTEVARVGVEKVVLKHGGSIDYTPSGALDWNPGKNRFLTAYREALRLNEPGQTFSPRMLIGRIVRAKVGHRTGNQNDPVTGKPEIYDEIAAVTRP
jgi:hypothetical protein